MKRFHSPFLKIQRIRHQQLRMAELEFARAQAAVTEAKLRIQNLHQQLTEAHGNLQRKLEEDSLIISGQNLHAVRVHIDLCDEQLAHQREHLLNLQDELTKARTNCQSLRSNTDGIDEFVRNKREDHRRQFYRAEQIQLDESTQFARRTGLRISAIDAGRSLDESNERGVIQT